MLTMTDTAADSTPQRTFQMDPSSILQDQVYKVSTTHLTACPHQAASSSQQCEEVLQSCIEAVEAFAHELSSRCDRSAAASEAFIRQQC